MSGKIKILIIIFAAIFLVVAGFFFNREIMQVKYLIKAPANYDECVKAKGKIMESYPPKCSFWGNIFVGKTEEEKDGDGTGQFCIQVITPAKNSATGECKEFPTPCDVPQGWEKVGACN